MSPLLATPVLTGRAILVGALACLAVGAGAYHAGAHDGLAMSPSLAAEYDATSDVVQSYAEELQRKHAELAEAHEVLTQAVRVYEDGSVVATGYHWDGTDLVPTTYEFCVDGALCDDDEPTTTAPGA